jgi:acyl dehydratase
VFATAPIHHDVDAAIAAGYSDVVTPPTFPIVIQEKTLQQLLSHPGAGIDFSRVVHGDQKFEYQRPLVAGDEVVATLRVTKIQSLGGHTMMTSESTITTAAGEPVVVATSTLVIRGEEG